jgi:hypothetical protein
MARKTASREYHFPVPNLDVPVGWRVGRAWFRPRCWLARHIDRRSVITAKASDDWYVERVRTDVGALECATVETRGTSLEAARARARDAVAVLRLYQRARYPQVSLDQQTFGLPADLISGHEDHWAIQTDGFPGAGWKRHGVLAPWSFTVADAREFHSDPRFQFLHAAFVARPPDELHRRATVAVQARDSARASLPPSLRIITTAVVLEAMLGDDDSHERAHRIARRLAYLECGQPDSRCGRDRPACFYLASKTTSEVGRNVDQWRAAGHHGLCSEYWHVRDLFDDRNAAVHKGRAFSEKTASNHAYRADHWLLSAVEWASQQDGARASCGIASLDAEVEAAVAKGLAEPPVSGSTGRD